MKEIINPHMNSARADAILQRALETGGERVYPVTDVYVTFDGRIVTSASDPDAAYLICAEGNGLPAKLASEIGVTGPSSVPSSMTVAPLPPLETAPVVAAPPKTTATPPADTKN